MEVASIRIDQALFGYREGHRLLQASRKFVPTTERSLLTLTDMSGSRMVDGFEEYLSGYPVPGEESYAFVKTWYAPEMERPGCVWSHVLVIRDSDFACLNDLAELVTLFRRPVDGEWQHYVTPALAVSEMSPMLMTTASIADAKALLVALYDHPKKPVIIPASGSQLFETLVLGVWSQQWPALRAAFRFCTGSLSNRTFAGQSFDLQVVPHKLLRELQRDSSAFVFQSIPSEDHSPDESAAWVGVGAADLVEAKGPFREFLWEYTDPGAGQRSLYSKLGELFTFFQAITDTLSLSGLSEITERISETFPEAKHGMPLKLAVYGRATSPRLWLPFIGEEARLIELAKTPYWDSFDGVLLGLRERAASFWRTDPTQGKALLLDLLDSSISPLADEVVAGFAEAISVVEACEIAQRRPRLLVALVMRNPRLVASETFWRCNVSMHTYYSVLDFLKTDRAAGVPVTTWIPVLLESGQNDLANAVIERFAAEAVNVFLQRAMSKGEEGNWIPDIAWRGALSTCQRELLAFFGREDYSASNRAMTLFAGLLDAHLEELATYGLRPWLALVKDAIDMVLQFPNADATGFLVSLAFQHSEMDALQLIAPCFEHVHAAARDDSPDPLSYRTWKSLEREVPVLSRSKNWDRCERLRQALIGRFVHNAWPKEEFLRCVSRPMTLRSVLYSCREVQGGEDFIRSLAEAVFSDLLNATVPQREVFRASFRRNRRGEIKFDL